MTGESGSVVITPREIYDELLDLKEIVAKRLPPDLEARLRAAEQKIAALWIVLTIVTGVTGSVLASILTKGIT